MVAKCLDGIFEVGIAGSELAGEPVAPAFHNSMAVGNQIKLASRTRLQCNVDIELLFNEGCETRSLGFVVASRKAIVDFYAHCGLLDRNIRLLNNLAEIIIAAHTTLHRRMQPPHKNRSGSPHPQPLSPK
jgi:hypothetical protein